MGGIPWWPFVDWAPAWPGGVPPGGRDGHSTVISLLYVYALERAAADGGRSRPAGRGGAAPKARRLSCATPCGRRPGTPRRGLFRDAPGLDLYSQQTNILAVLTDAVPAASKRALMERVLD